MTKRSVIHVSLSPEIVKRIDKFKKLSGMSRVAAIRWLLLDALRGMKL